MTDCKLWFLYRHWVEHRCKILENHFGGGSTEIRNTYTSRSPLGHYFLLPNEIFTLGLSPGELSVYAYLIFCEDRKTHQCWPSIGRNTFASSLVNGIKQADGSIKSLTPRQVADLLGHSTSQITELYYVKKDTSRLHGITDGFNL